MIGNEVENSENRLLEGGSREFLNLLKNLAGGRN